MTHTDRITKTRHIVSFLAGSIVCTLGAMAVMVAGIRAGETKPLPEALINLAKKESRHAHSI